MEDWYREEGLDEVPDLGCFNAEDGDCRECSTFNKVVNTLRRMIFEDRKAEAYMFLGYWDIKLKHDLGTEHGSILNALIEGAPSEIKEMLKSGLEVMYGKDRVDNLKHVSVLSIPKHMMN